MQCADLHVGTFTGACDPRRYFTARTESYDLLNRCTMNPDWRHGVSPCKTNPVIPPVPRRPGHGIELGNASRDLADSGADAGRVIMRRSSTSSTRVIRSISTSCVSKHITLIWCKDFAPNHGHSTFEKAAGPRHHRLRTMWSRTFVRDRMGRESQPTLYSLPLLATPAMRASKHPINGNHCQLALSKSLRSDLGRI